MDIHPSGPEQEQQRWLLLLHVLLGVTLAIPTGFMLVDQPADAPVTLALVAAFVAVYATLFVRPQRHHGDPRLLLVYALLATVLYTALVLRVDAYILVLYALLPQFFSVLPRWLAALGVAVLALLPGMLEGGLDVGDLFNAVAAVGLGLVVTLIIDALERRTEEQRVVIAELEAARVENERLAEEAAVQGRAAGVLAERQRLAHDIHDTLAQGFTSIVTQLEAAEQAIAAGDPGAVRRASDHVERAKRTAREGLAEARRTVEALRPAPLEETDLPGALRDLARRWRERVGGGMTVDVVVDVVDDEPAPVPGEVEAALLRVAQEALTNVAHHADAEHVTVTVTHLDDALLLDVQDDGVGLVPRPTGDGRTGFGLTSMRERVALLGGELTVEGVRGEGTTIAARVPLAPRRAPADDPAGVTAGRAGRQRG